MEGAHLSEPISLIPQLLKLRTFMGASESDLRSLLDATNHRTLQRGELLAEVGEPADSAWLVVRGRLHIEVGPDSQHIGEIWPGEMVGEEGVFGVAATRVTSFRAAQDSLVLVLDRKTLDDSALASNPAMGALQRHMLRVCTRRLNALDTTRYRTDIAPHLPDQPAEDTQPAIPDSPRAWLRALFGGDR